MVFHHQPEIPQLCSPCQAALKIKLAEVFTVETITCILIIESCQGNTFRKCNRTVTDFSWKDLEE